MTTERAMNKQWIYKCTEYFGWLHFLPALLCLAVLPFYDVPVTLSKASVGATAFLLTLVGGSLIYSSRQQFMGTDLGEKAYPASLVSYLLFVLIGAQWL
ncbi:MAG: hypothetical protein JKX83_08805 [Pseudomonadales bacterium]|nr:hypothetical protein [Pseudomonadales bacterium]